MEATLAVRKILSASINPPVHVIIQAKIVPKLVEFLSRNKE